MSVQTDVFAYGCFLYEIETGKPPYHEYDSSDDRARLVQQFYQDNQFPDIDHLALGAVIRKCWDTKCISMREVIRTLGNLLTEIQNSQTFGKEDIYSQNIGFQGLQIKPAIKIDTDPAYFAVAHINFLKEVVLH